MQPDLYSILNIKSSATQQEIKASFKLLAKTLHPDAGGGTEAFAKLHSAYMVLRDKARRKKYDESGDVSKQEVNEELTQIARILLELLNAWIEEGIADRTNINMIDAMQKHVKKEISGMEKVESNIKKELDALKKIQDRLSCKLERNILGGVIELKRSALAKKAAEVKYRVLIFRLLFDDLSNYTYITEMAEFIDMHYFGAVSATA